MKTHICQKTNTKYILLPTFPQKMVYGWSEHTDEYLLKNGAETTNRKLIKRQFPGDVK